MLDITCVASAYIWAVSTLQLTIDAKMAMAPFEQVRTQIAAAIAQGRLAPGTKLPTVRQLAADLGLAANTVARAYRELEADEIIATHGRRGTFVRSDILDQPAQSSPAPSSASPPSASPPSAAPSSAAPSSAAHAAREAAAAYVHSVRRLGLSSPEALRLVENAWNQGEFTATR